MLGLIPGSSNTVLVYDHIVIRKPHLNQKTVFHRVDYLKWPHYNLTYFLF